MIAILQRLGNASASQISQQLHRTRPDILHHMQILIKEGVVEKTIPAMRPSGRGRPPVDYHLTTTSSPEELSTLVKAMFSVVSTHPDLIGMLEKIARQITGPVSQVHSSSPAVLNQAVEWLNRHGYQASWEAGAHGPRIRLRHCPYRSLSEEHPMVCHLDACILQNLVGECMALAQVKPAGRGSSSCIFEQTTAHRKN
jgi:predicted ArsR family transcriptional regulator